MSALAEPKTRLSFVKKVHTKKGHHPHVKKKKIAFFVTRLLNECFVDMHIKNFDAFKCGIYQTF